MLVKDFVLSEFKVSVIDKSVDGILVLKFVNLHTDFTFFIICMLPVSRELCLGS